MTAPRCAHKGAGLFGLRVAQVLINFLEDSSKNKNGVAMLLRGYYFTQNSWPAISGLIHSGEIIKIPREDCGLREGEGAIESGAWPVNSHLSERE